MRATLGNRSSAWLLIALAILGLGWWALGRRPEPGGERGVRPRPSTEAPVAVQAPSRPASAVQAAPALRDPEAREIPSAPARLVAGEVVLPPGAPAGPRGAVVLRTVADGVKVERRARLDASGAFAFTVPARVRHAILEIDDDFLYLERPEHIDLDRGSEALRLEPRLGGCLVVRVVGSDGRSVADAIGALVALRARGGRGALVDARGQASFGGLAPGAVGYILCHVPGFAALPTDETRSIEAGATLELELRLAREARLAGRVLDTTGLPVVNALVSTGETISALTDAGGSFELRGLAPGPVVLQALHHDHRTVKLRIEDLKEDEQRHGLELTLDMAGLIGGRVVWPDHSPVLGVLVEISGAMQVGSEGDPAVTISHGIRVQANPTDAAGRFEIRTPGRGLFTVTALHRRAGQLRRKVHGDDAHTVGARMPHEREKLEGVAAGDMDLLLVLQRGASLAGRVVDELGEVPGSARVRARRVTERGPDAAGTWQASRAEGTFRFDDLEPGLYEVSATFGAGLGEAQRIEVPPFAADLVLVAPRGARIEGHVLAGGLPVAGASVELRWRSGPQRVFVDGQSKGIRTDASGRFEIGSILPAEHVLQAKHPTLGRSAGQVLRVANGDVLRGVVLELETPGWIEGRIAPEIDRRGGRTVQVVSRNPVEFARATTDADGLFTVPDLRPGIHEVRLQSEGAPSLYDAAVTAAVHGGRGTQVVLSGDRRAVRILGRVTAGGRAAPDMEVRAYLTTGTEGFEADARTDELGAFALELPEGGDVAFVFGELESGPGSERFVPDGQTTSLHFDLPIGVVAGRLLAHDGRPAAGALVRLVSESRSKIQQCEADSEGRFSLQHVAPGHLVVSAGGTRIFASGFTPAAPVPSPRVYGFRRGEPFELAAGEHRTNVALVLPAPASLRGSLRLPAGSSSGEFWILATPDAAGTTLPVSRAEIEGDRYQLRGLGPGLYEIQAIAYGERPSMVSRHVTLTEGQDLVLDLELE